MVFVLFAGLHEPTGDCKAKSPVQTAFGMVLEKKTFLCTTDYDEQYYDWHCLPGGKPPKNGLDTYTVCGTPFPNHVEYIIVVCAFCFLGLYIYMQMLMSSGKQHSVQAPPPQVVRPKSKSAKQKRY